MFFLLNVETQIYRTKLEFQNNKNLSKIILVRSLFNLLRKSASDLRFSHMNICHSISTPK